MADNIALGAFAESAKLRRRLDIAEQATGLQERELEFEQRKALLDEVRKAQERTRTEMANVLKFATTAKEKGGDPAKIAELRDDIEFLGKSVPGLEFDTRMMLQRFDATVGLTPSPTEAATREAQATVAGARATAEAAGVPESKVFQAKGIIPEEQGPFKGTGMSQQSANTLIGLSPKIRAGTATDEEKRAYSIAYNHLTAPRIVGTPDTGFSMFQQTLDPRVFPFPDGAIQPPTDQGPKVTPLGERQRPPNRAGRTSMVEQGARTVRNIHDQLINPDGSVNRTLVFSLATDIPFAGRGVPFSEGRTLRAQLEDALSAKLRLETGAQANEKEIQNIIDRFMPSPLFDSDETIRDKMNRLVQFFESALKLTDPELFEELSGRAEQTPPSPPANEKDAIFDRFQNGNPVFRRPDGSEFMTTDGEN